MACLWSRRAAFAAEPVAALSPIAWVEGLVPSNAAIVSSVRRNVEAEPAAADDPRTTAGVPPDAVATAYASELHAVDPSPNLNLPVSVS